jgi:hypothetical protein
VLSASPFGFTTLDGLAFAAERGRLNGRIPARMTAVSLGPVIEMAHLARAGILPAPDMANWLALDGLAVLYRAVLSGRLHWVCPDGRRIGFLRTRRTDPMTGRGYSGSVWRRAKAPPWPGSQLGSPSNLPPPFRNSTITSTTIPERPARV